MWRRRGPARVRPWGLGQRARVSAVEDIREKLDVLIDALDDDAQEDSASVTLDGIAMSAGLGGEVSL